MANQKYDNLTTLQANGGLNWPGDIIEGILTAGAVFSRTQVRFSELGTVPVLHGPITGRSIGDDGELLGWPVSFHRVAKETTFQLVIVKNDGSNDPLLLAFYDTDDANHPLSLKNTGTLIVRPFAAENPDPPVLGVWVKAS